MLRACKEERLRNLITDVAGVRVGHADDASSAPASPPSFSMSPRSPASTCAAAGRARAKPPCSIRRRRSSGIDAIALSGGSAFGLDAAAGVQAWLREQGRGFAVRAARVPIVPAAILFDLLNGGDKDWGRYPPYRELGYAAAASAGADFALGSVGAGLGAQTVNLKGGLGSASAQRRGLHGRRAGRGECRRQRHVGDGPHFWAAPFEQARNSAAADFRASIPADALEPHSQRQRRHQHHPGGGRDRRA